MYAAKPVPVDPASKDHGPGRFAHLALTVIPTSAPLAAAAALVDDELSFEAFEAAFAQLVADVENYSATGDYGSLVEDHEAVVDAESDNLS